MSLDDGRAGREEGIERTRAVNTDWVEWMRGVAVQISKRDGNVSTDELHPFATGFGWHPTEPRCYGAIFFPRSCWLKIGYKQSERKVCHARPIPIWQYIGGDDVQ